MNEPQPTIPQLFIARRIAEFPTLFGHGDQVIYSLVIGNQGGCFWDKNGLLQQGDKSYNSKTVYNASELGLETTGG